MAALLSTDFTIPAEISQGIFEKAQKGSTLSQLSGARPQKFGKQQVWVLTAPPKAELVGEGGKKSPTPTTYAAKTVNPFKLQVTMRFSQEVQWADEDVQIGVLQDLASNAGIALGRALDLVGIHKINPLTGTVSDMVKEGLIDTTQSVQLKEAKYDDAIEAAAGVIISSGYTPSGIAMDPTLSFGLSTMRDANGRKIYPEIGFGQNLTNFSGMQAAVSDTVSAKNEITPDTKLLGIVGQFDAFRWGVQRSIGAHLIEYGDPDGLGDLQRQNQIAIRAEIVYGIGIMDQAAFTKIVKAEG
jgi:HK97 family phage major capsid protein